MSNATAIYSFPAHMLAAVAEFAAKKDRRTYINGVVLRPNQIVGLNRSILAFGTNKVTHEGHPDPVLLSNATVKDILRNASAGVTITVRVREADRHPDTEVSELPKGTRFLSEPPTLEVQYSAAKKGSPAFTQLLGTKYQHVLPPYEEVVPTILTPEDGVGYGINMDNLIVLANARKALRKFGIMSAISFRIEDSGAGVTPWTMTISPPHTAKFHPLGLSGVMMPVDDSFKRGSIVVV